jgi:hypothetical protein
MERYLKDLRIVVGTAYWEMDFATFCRRGKVEKETEFAKWQWGVFQALATSLAYADLRVLAEVLEATDSNWHTCHRPGEIGRPI